MALAKVNKFELKLIQVEELPHLENFDTIDGYQIKRSNFNTSLFTIYDEENQVYRTIEYHGNDLIVLNEDLRRYIDYYKLLPREDKVNLRQY